MLTVRRRPGPIASARVLGLTALVALCSTGCQTSPTDVTCDEFAQQSHGDQGSTIRDLLEAHRLEPMDTGNVIGLSTALMTWCGLSTFGGGAADVHGSQPIDGAVDWDAKSW